MKVAILDYGTGNVRTLKRALEEGGAEVTLESDPTVAAGADALVLPDAGGLGALATHVGGAAPALRATLVGGLPCLAIGAGMHFLFETDSAGGTGLGMVRGSIARLTTRRSPHMGWNRVDAAGAGARELLEEVAPTDFYFAHGSVAEPADSEAVRGRTVHEGVQIPAIVRSARTWGVQFRPEKSSGAGLRLIRNFLQTIGA